MVENFFRDLEIGRKAEYIVKDTFSYLTDKYTFESVGDQREYFYKGDIKATAADGKEIFIEVKNDRRIADTKNVLCEDKVFYYDNNKFGRGNMQSETDIFCIVNEVLNWIYVIDFKTLKERYKEGVYKVIPHSTQDTYCYLVPLKKIEEWGALLAIVCY